ncbi:MAG: class I poly(R)-hydroxyalkanoic acid synthase [Alphaproteobacteria bacterium]|nr:class I poly(R)-hydroxyalkanoic acid synthase [Alphaproteobacteria bacterium]
MNAQEKEHPFNPVAFGQALLNAYEKAQPLWESYLKKYDPEQTLEQFSSINFDPLNVHEIWLEYMDKLAQNPEKFIRIQTDYMQDWMNLMQDSVSQFMGQKPTSVFDGDKTDRRFKAPEWQESAIFDFIKKSYLMTCNHLDKTISEAEGLSEEQKRRLSFQTKIFTDALSPTNFVLTNPEVLNETIKTGGENLVKGFENLLKDLQRGHGELNISTTDDKAFELGKNIAATKGSVIYENDLMQLIQYAPETDKVYKTPLLIIPPWINKYYILDLAPDKSLIEWALTQGHSVFTISWVNPSVELANKRFEDYMQEGVLESLDQIKKISGEDSVNAMGYCLGGTLLAITLAYLCAKKQEDKINSATFLTTLLDFEHAGDMKLFLGDDQIELIEKGMMEKGVLSGKEMQRTFSLMRANDLIWSFVVNNYLMGKEPFPFDLLYWNDDCTNMPAKMHSFYLRNMYRDNALITSGKIDMFGTPIDLAKIKKPCYFLSTKEDHIAPWIATYEGTKLVKGDVTFTLAASGHIAGVVNPPSKNKYCYWTYDKNPKNPQDWLDKATQHEGSWWPHWQDWIKGKSGTKVKARNPAKGIEPAPGRYVKVRV